ncbi:putative toxin-antitoxin system toxin component, PIN family, partial [Candidatus Aminicenantes bacterium AC-334-E05]|nr:putative toxin-antitoxin system toxin component, PIN family [Candidatus Aminicenantes bacterium AC-334-E05]
RVLRLKFKRTTFEIFLILTGIRNITTFVSPILKISEIKNDEPDNRVLECAIEGKANYIISGDKHLLSLKKYKEIEILNAGEFLNRFRSD